MDQEKERQLTMLQKIYENWMPPTPAFKANHEGVPDGMVPYISCSDVHDYKYNIRIIPEDVFLSEDDDQYEKMEEGTIIAHYESMETAEAAMRLFIENERKRLTEEEYRHYCLGYQLCERKVFICPNFDEGPCISWNFYTAIGELSQNHISE